MCIFIYLCLFSCLALSSLSLALLSFALRPCCRVPAGCWPRDSTAVRPAECDVLARKRETQRASRHNIQASPPHGEATVKRHEEIKKGDPTHKCCFFFHPTGGVPRGTIRRKSAWLCEDDTHKSRNKKNKTSIQIGTIQRYKNDSTTHNKKKQTNTVAEVLDI